MRLFPAHRLAVAIGLAFIAANPALARPGGFGCLWPANNLVEKTTLSRYYFNRADRVYILTVYLNETAPEQDGIFDDRGISIGVGSTGPHKVGVCKIVPPNLQSVGRIRWREIKAGSDPGVFDAIDIRQALPPDLDSDLPTGARFGWVVLRPTTPAVSGKVTIEFHVHTMDAAYLASGG